MSTQPDPAVILRQPFAPEQIGKLPKISCRACSKAPGKVCSDHSKSKCKACGNYITTAHVDLDYVTRDGLLHMSPTATAVSTASSSGRARPLRSGGRKVTVYV